MRDAISEVQATANSLAVRQLIELGAELAWREDAKGKTKRGWWMDTTFAELKTIKVGTKIEITFDGGAYWGDPMKVYDITRPFSEAVSGDAWVQGYAKNSTRDMLFAAIQDDDKNAGTSIRTRIAR